MKKIIVLFGFLSLLSLQSKAQWQWVDNHWDYATNWGNSVCTDASGNCYTTGGTGLNTGGGDDKIFVMKNDASGNQLWYLVSNVDNGQYREGEGICTDAFGHLYVTGYYQSYASFIFGTTTLSDSTIYNSEYVFLLKLDLSGNVIWAKGSGGITVASANGVVTDPSGNIYISGAFYGDSIRFGTHLFTSSFHPPSPSGFVVKYDSLGNVVWAVKTTDSLNYFNFNNKIAIDGSGNLYVIGTFAANTATFGTYTLANSNPGTSDIYILKMDSNGNIIWAKSEGGNLDDESNDIAADNSGNFYITGSYKSPTLDFGTTTLTNLGNDDGFITKYDSAGTAIWAKSIGGTGSEIATGVSCNTTGNVFVTGNFTTHYIGLGSNYLLNASVSDTTDIFVLKYDASGNLVGATNPKGDMGDGSNAICADNLGNAFITGYSKSFFINFDSHIFNSDGWWNMYTAKLDATTLGVNEITNQQSPIEIYPNPTTGELRITNYELRIKEIKVFNVLGCVILKQVQNDKSATIDMSAVAKGIYFVQIKTERGVVMKKVVKE